MADIFDKVSCTYCQDEINGVRIQCCECPDFDICLQCFAVGAEIGPHKNDHPYKFVDHCAVSIFGGRGAWTGTEHLKLLDAAELYSYGSWDKVAAHVETRTAEECKEEYIARYLNGNIGLATWAEVSKPNLYMDLIEDEGPLSQKALSKLPPLDATLEEARVLGYKPHRDDFEGEYNPEAERLVSDLQLDEQGETEIEKCLKLAKIDMYIRRLRERQRRKRIVRDYQLVAKYFDNLRRDPTKPLYPQAEKELRDGMRPFAQFLNSGEHERLIASVNRERELRHRLSELKRYRSLGLTTHEEIVHYEQHMAFQKLQVKQGKVRRRGKLKFHRRKNHVAVRKRFRVRQRGGAGHKGVARIGRSAGVDSAHDDDGEDDDDGETLDEDDDVEQ
ncbi:transcriptional adapter 2B-like [Sitophilus oryzae]|uniref:Transcriptional adapter n=1 Tax=Sitophilus oryzae TaxID=7048 RepID=A0A6J2Y790_SITOR|nr:transcriptional adapter 2B-like [Sitophilus oryzae]